ncbi:HIV Tat-specific factor 1 homolog [Spodoptera frugiperda]|uniref:17S U2 SnRNP complex component HTATSF1 n=1 Tax=Spodoptera frugiperda TaxID=7108 RepID=A0A9R0EPW8_SPOFR|nr:HIV Tat-specific factor 1 homolog [Spodoptera frugiperda]
MARQEKGLKTGFVIKLSNETVQKLVEEESQAKPQVAEVSKSESENKDSNKIDEKLATESKDNSKSEVSLPPESDKKDTNPQTANDQDKSDKSNVTDKDTSKAESTWGDYAPYITYEGEEAIYTDPSNNQKYIWSTESNSWTLKPGQEVQGREYSYENDTHIYTEADGSKFFWDVDKKAWIPKVDDDFLALYQMSYGFVDNKAEEKDKSKVEDKKKEQKKADVTAAAGVKRKAEPQWFQPSEETNTKVYVSNLPLDLTEEEFVNFMQKCGLVERDPSSQKMKVKLYKDKEQDCFKGDALCTYIKIESVDLALKLLDGSDFKGNKIKVERASFQMKGEYNPALKPKKKKKKELEKIKKMQQKLFDWRPEKFIGERSKHERVVIVKNLFHPTDFDQEVQLILDYQQDLREECGKCGEVRKVVIYDRHPEGVAQITMKEPEMADAVVELINGRWFGKRQITAEIWDGRTKYRIAETDSEISKRINKWDQFLEGKEGEEKKNGSKESADSKKKEESSEITDVKSVDNIEMKDATENVSGDSKTEATNETTKVVDVKHSD